jgi:hypothetical protein
MGVVHSLVENWKICAVACAEKKTLMKDTKKENSVISPEATRRVPYLERKSALVIARVQCKFTRNLKP